jgi:hypothetical protein
MTSFSEGKRGLWLFKCFQDIWQAGSDIVLVIVVRDELFP